MWSSPTLPILKAADTDNNPLGAPITLHQEALIASLHSLGISIGGLFLSRLADFLGRKWTLIFISILELSSLMVLAFAHNVQYYYVTRLTQGSCLGASATVLPLFISEITEDHNRGKFGTLSTFFICFGNIYGFTMGSFFNVKIFTLFCCAPLLVSIPLFIIFIPESPIYLVSKGNKDEAKRHFMKYRNIGSSEADNVVKNTEYMIFQPRRSQKGPFACVEGSVILKAFCISILLFVLQQLSGIFAVMAYLKQIFSSAHIPLSENASSILISFIQLLAILISTSLIERLGRKFLLLTSSATVTISLLFLGMYFQLQIANFSYLHYISWLPLISLITFILGYGFGLGPVCFIIMSEVFPQDFKGKAASVSLFSSGISSFAVVYAFPIVRDLLGIAWCFWILAICSLLGIIFIYVLVPETKGKSFLEIQILLEKKL